MQSGGREISALALATGAIVTTEFIVIGLMPMLAADFGVELGTAGWLVSVFALSAAVPGPFVTLLSARCRPREGLAGVLAAFGLGSLIAAAVPIFEVMIIVRIVQGALLTAFVSGASSAAADIAPYGRGGRAIGHVNLGTVIGIVFAVPAGVALADAVGWRTVFAVLGVATLAGAGCLLAVMPRALKYNATSLPGQLGILGRPRFLAHLVLSILLFTAMFSAYSYIASFLQDVLGLRATEVALALLGFGIAGIVGNWLASRSVDNDPTRLTAVITLVLVVATATTYLTQRTPALAAFVLVIWGGAHMAAFVACQVRVMFAAQEAPAFAASLNIAACNLGISAGTVLGGWVVAAFGVATVGLAAASVGSGACAVGAFLITRLPNTEAAQREKVHPHASRPRSNSCEA